MHLDKLRTAESGVRSAVDELNALGGGTAVSAGAGSDGRGLDQLDTDADTVGHQQLATALGNFVDRWQWELRDLVGTGMNAADALSDTRSTYQHAEDTAWEALTRVEQLVTGNPMGEAN